MKPVKHPDVGKAGEAVQGRGQLRAQLHERLVPLAPDHADGMNFNGRRSAHGRPALIFLIILPQATPVNDRQLVIIKSRLTHMIPPDFVSLPLPGLA